MTICAGVLYCQLGVWGTTFPRIPSLHVSQLELVQSEAVQDLGGEGAAATLTLKALTGQKG